MKITIRADEGKWLTDGKNYGKTILLSENGVIDDYYEISDEQYESIMSENV